MSAMPRYDKFQSSCLDILAQLALNFSTKFELRPVLKERAAFVITFAIKHVCYSCRITIIVHKQVRNDDNQTLFVIFGIPPSF